MFRTESDFYQKIAPRLKKVSGSVMGKEVNSPICFFGDYEQGVLVMEDLREAGYKLRPKRLGNTQYIKIYFLKSIRY